MKDALRPHREGVVVVSLEARLGRNCRSVAILGLLPISGTRFRRPTSRTPDDLMGLQRSTSGLLSAGNGDSEPGRDTTYVTV